MRVIRCTVGIACLCASWFGTMASGAVSEIVYQGKPCLLLENRFIRMVVSPADGGMCMVMEHKPTGKRFTVPDRGALLGNRVWNYAERELYMQWERCAWEHEVSKSPGEATVVLRANGQVGFTRSTQFERRIALRDDECKVRVDYVFHVGSQLMKPQRIGLWFKNFCTVSQEPMTCYVPLDDGTVALDQASSTGQSWFYNPARGWAAIAGTSGTGLAFEIEFRRLMCFYQWRSGNTACFEWALRSFDVPNGGNLHTQGEVVAFTGLPAVHGAGGGIVAGFDLPSATAPTRAKVGLQTRAVVFAGQSAEGELVVTAQRLPDGAPLPVHRQKLSLPVGEPVSVAFRVALPQPGTWRLRGQWLEQGRLRMDFNAPLQVGDQASPYRLPPLEPRIGRASERFEDKIALRGSAPPDIELSTEIEGEHVKWAKPYSKGKLRVLVLTSILNGREAVELAERLDMEIVWVSVGLDNERGALAGMLNLGRHSPYTVDHINHSIRDRLTGKVDAIIVGGLSGELFQADTLTAIRRKVESGTGLVWVAPNRGEKALYDMLPVAKEKHLRHRNGKWKVAKPHFLTLGVPFDQLPATDYVLCQAEAEPLATVGRGPLLVASEGPGKGRVAVLTYNTGWQGVGQYMTGITPWVRDAPEKFKYSEHHFSLLCKCLVWAARREPDVQWSQIEVTDAGDAPKLVAGVRNIGEALEAEAHLTVSDAWGTVLLEQRTPIALPQGETRLALPIGVALPDGLNVADVILSSRGKVVAWGSAALNHHTGVSVTGLAFDKKVYYPGDTVNASAKLSAEQAQSVDLLATLTDSLGRRIGEKKLKLTVEANTSVDLQFSIGKPLTTVGRIRVTASRSGRLVAAREADFVMLPESFANRQWADWESQVWGNPAGAYERDYMIPLKARVLKAYGMDTVITGSRWLHPIEYESAVRAGFKIMPMGAAYRSLHTNHVPKGKLTFDQARKAYLKTHEKGPLVRPVCLNDPADLKPLAEKLRTLAEYAAPLEPIGYNLGDEMSITYYVTPFDYCFGEKCLATFRDWLKPRYDSLAALNRAWATQFASWDSVMPMTAHEAKGRGNYAPWAEHREFMDDTFQNFFRWVRARLRERDPKAGVGLSGSQAAEAYGGYDWSKLVHTLDFVQNYVHRDTIMMQRSFGRDLNRAPWYGYMRRNPDMRQALWQRFLNGNRGGAYFVIRYMFFPDYRPTVSTRHAAEVVAELKGGVASLFNRLERVNDIAIHYSQASIRGAYICGHDTLFTANRHGWIQAMEDLGFQCEFVSAKELVEGKLDRHPYAALVLPYSVAMSNEEADACRRYVRKGGLVLADARTGLMDNRCTTRSTPLLDDLFGLRRPKPDALSARREGEVRGEQDLGECKLNGLSMDVELAEPKLRVDTAKALGRHSGAPALAVHPVGKGVAVFLNFFMQSYPRRRTLGMEADLARMVENLLRLRDAERPIRVTAKAAPNAHFYAVRFRSGQAAYLGIVHEVGLIQGAEKSAGADKRRAEESIPIQVELPAESFVYDIRKGKPRGRVRVIEDTILEGDAKLYALLPYRVVALDVKATGCPQGASVRYSVRVRTEGATPEVHAFRVEVTTPSGNPARHYGQNLVARHGSAEAEFQTALNDPVGKWTLRATDVATGVTASASFALSGR